MGEGSGKTSKALIYLESILFPSQAVKSLIALVICTKHFECSWRMLRWVSGKNRAVQHWFQTKSYHIADIGTTSSSGMDYRTLHNQLNAPRKKYNYICTQHRALPNQFQFESLQQIKNCISQQQKRKGKSKITWMTFIICHSRDCLKRDLIIMLVQWELFPGKYKQEINDGKR